MKHFYLIQLNLFFFTFFSYAVFATELNIPTFQEVECKIHPVKTQKGATIRSRKKPGRRSFNPISDYRSTPCLALNKEQNPITSLNWSGYLAFTSLSTPVKQSVQGVAGEWLVPLLTKTSGDSYCSIFVGLDGFFSGNLEQIGTQHQFKKGRQQNIAWFQISGQMYQIEGFLLSPGDHIGAGVSYQGNNVFQLTIVNYTKNIYLPIPTSYTTSSADDRWSAEWIVETPQEKILLPLANFGTVSFYNCRAEINGVTDNLSTGHFEVKAVEMRGLNSQLKASPTSIKNGNSFSVIWKGL